MADDNNIDIISSLPTDKLAIILSYLPFKDVAKTTILSTRWRDVLHSTKNVEFIDTFFVKLHDSEEDKARQRGAFVDFTRKFITKHNALQINTFCLIFSSPVGFLEEVENCIAFASARQADELTLDFHDPMWPENDIGNHAAQFTMSLAAHHHNWTALRSLKLFSCGFIVREFHHFTRLKQLSLGWIELRMDSIRDLLMTYCPLVENLSLRKCWNIEFLYIPAPNTTLQTLVIDRCNFHLSLFRIGTRNLKVFKYCGKGGRFFFEHHVPIIEAELEFALLLHYNQDGRFIRRLLIQLLKVRVLTVCSYELKVAPTNMVDELPIRLNVRHLILNTTMLWNEFIGIKFMLKICPVLETLTINIVPPTFLLDFVPPYRIHMRELMFCKCIRRTLKVVEVKGFRGSPNELYVLIYLLRYGNIMEELKLYLSSAVGANDENMRQGYFFRAQVVQVFPKASDNVIISIHD